MLLQRTLNIPFFFLIGERSSAGIGDVLLEHNLIFRSPLMVTGMSRTAEIAKRFDLDRTVPGAELACVRSNSFDDVEALRRELAARRSDLAIAIGGGKVVDVVKLASYSQGIPFLAVPTTLSNDGLASPVAVVYRSVGMLKESVAAHMPLGVIVDLAFVRQAPTEILQAGVGDLVSNISALEDWRYASRVAGERIDTFAMLLANTAADMIIHYVRSRHEQVDIRGNEFLTRLGEGLILSGLAMEIAGSSRPCSGAEHLLSHALDHLLSSPRPHGLQVGVATLYVERLRGNNPEAIKRVFEKLGMPTAFSDLGIDNNTLDEALRIGPSMRPGRPTILDEQQVLGRARDAMQDAVL